MLFRLMSNIIEIPKLYHLIHFNCYIDIKALIEMVVLATILIEVIFLIL